MTLANWITLSRIFLIPAVLVFSSQELWLSASITFFWIMLSDFIDGKIARKLKQITALGSLLDPVADKAVILSLILLPHGAGLVPTWFVVLVYTRNISQLMSIPILKGWLKIDFKVKPALPAKYATALGFALIWLYLLDEAFAGPLDLAIIWGLVPVCAILEAYVLVTYLPRFFQIARRRQDTFE